MTSEYLLRKPRTEVQARADIERDRYLAESDPHFLRRILDGAVEVERDEHGKRITGLNGGAAVAGIPVLPEGEKRHG